MLCGASARGSPLATGGERDRDPIRDPELGTSQLFWQASGFTRNPSRHYKQKNPQNLSAGVKKVCSSNGGVRKGRVHYSVYEGIRHTQ